MNTLQPPAWPRPRGYANGIAARGTMIAVAGQIGWNAQGAFETNDPVGPVRQALSTTWMLPSKTNPRGLVNPQPAGLSREGPDDGSVVAGPR